MEAKRSFFAGVIEAVSVVALFVGAGLGYAEWIGGAASSRTAEPALYFPAVEELEPTPQVWLVDGYNVLAVGLLAGREREGWWSARFRDELLGRLEAFEEPEAEIWVVFDGARHAAQVARSEPKASEDPQGGRAQRGEAERRSDGRASRIRSVFAPSADDWLLARLGERDPRRTTLVTADRSLADRARHRGVSVVAPAEFLARCRALG